jgi:hypothetical protein
MLPIKILMIQSLMGLSGLKGLKGSASYGASWEYAVRIK